ncbi:dUTP diphosphatase [Rickettsiales bacterium]|nr:dUTP diphosphatase [Rickettsiales bacterium]
MKLQIKQLKTGINTPKYATTDSAGFDLEAACDQDITIEPGENALIPTGIAMALTKGYEAQVRPRSGLALKKSITVLNTPGTIDADYRGEVGVILINHGKENFIVNKGMRIAQIIINKYEKAEIEVVDNLDETERGAGGFGSTGTKSVA